jgi:hypothetical protein
MSLPSLTQLRPVASEMDRMLHASDRDISFFILSTKSNKEVWSSLFAPARLASLGLTAFCGISQIPLTIFAPSILP